MSEYQLMELIFLAVLAGYLIYRLYLVLGQSEGGEDLPRSKKTDNIIPLNTVKRMREAVKIKTNPPCSKEAPVQKSAGVFKDLQQVDPDFDQDHFQQGAEAAFVMIVESFAEGNLEKIKPYISAHVYGTFDKVVKKRLSRKESHKVQVVGIISLTVVAAQIVERMARLTVQIESDQATTITNAEGQDLHPEQNEIERVLDQWVFSRSLDSSDPNWVLEEIQTVSDEKAKK